MLFVMVLLQMRQAVRAVRAVRAVLSTYIKLWRLEEEERNKKPGVRVGEPTLTAVYLYVRNMRPY